MAMLPRQNLHAELFSMLSLCWHSHAKTAPNSPKMKQPLIAKWLFLKNAVVEAAGIEPASASTLQTVLHT